MPKGIIFHTMKGKKKGVGLISENLLNCRKEIMKNSLKEYEEASNGYGTIVSARFDKKVSEEIEKIEKDSSVVEFKIIKYGALGYTIGTTLNCLCGNKLRRIEEEIVKEKDSRKKIEYKKFYFCDYCGFSGKLKKGSLL